MLKIKDIIKILKQIEEEAIVIEYDNEPILVEEIDYNCPYKKYKSVGSNITIKIEHLVEKVGD